MVPVNLPTAGSIHFSTDLQWSCTERWESQQRRWQASKHGSKYYSYNKDTRHFQTWWAAPAHEEGHICGTSPSASPAPIKPLYNAAGSALFHAAKIVMGEDFHAVELRALLSEISQEKQLIQSSSETTQNNQTVIMVHLSATCQSSAAPWWKHREEIAQAAPTIGKVVDDTGQRSAQRPGAVKGFYCDKMNECMSCCGNIIQMMII